MALNPVLDRQTVLDRLRRPSLNPFVPEEEKVHPWQTPYLSLFQPLFQEPLLRIWDQDSGSRPDQDNYMTSRAPEMRLDDRESRRTSLSRHINYRDWTPSPYISFTTNPARVEDLVEKRAAKRGTQWLTVIDPNKRLRKGLPILSVKEEIDHYDIQDPYGGYYEYYYEEYLCLWQVTPAEVIGTCEWNSLVDDNNWYRNIILPAFRRFTATADTYDLQSSFAKPSGTFITVQADIYIY
ncbi:hypothetical protein F5B18DRAFT_78170 [Nemania serpens]|nr:hypothetical protein F5B18DRAFT_78170 [Nemania serpens]